MKMHYQKSFAQTGSCCLVAVLLLLSCTAQPEVPAPTQTFEPTITFAPPTNTPIPITATPTNFYPDYPSGRAILHEKDENIPYNYWSYVPKSLTGDENAYILLEVSHGQIEDYAQLTNDSRNAVDRFISVAEKFKFIILTPVIPRDFTKGYYPQGINEYALNPSTPDFYYRPDLKVNIILEHFKLELENAGFSIQEKVFVSGFSAGGMWANRYTLLHPEMVKAVAIGHSGGWLAMPITNYKGINLRWPLGLYNYSNLTGEEYNGYDLLKNVPMFIYIGDQDNSNTYYSNYPGKDLITIWGNIDPLRLENQYNYLKNLGFNVTFKLYPNVSHRYNDQMVNDVVEFFVANHDE